MHTMLQTTNADTKTEYGNEYYKQKIIMSIIINDLWDIIINY